jgi:NitT/TauT family transport system substrate-binding protein
MTMRIRSLIWCSAVLLACSAGGARAQERLVLGYSNLQSSKIPVPIAKEAGLFAKYGLDVEMIRVTPGNLAVPKLLSGEIQLFLGNGDPVVKAAVKDGAKLVVIASLGEDNFRLVARSAIRTIEDLKGKRVGVSNPGSSADRIARAALKAVNLDPDRDVTLVTTGLNESRARLEQVVSGDVDATIVDLENVKALGDRGAAITSLAELEQLGIFVSGADLSTTRALIETRRDTVKRFLAALVDAIALAKHDPEIVRRAYRQYGNVTEPHVLEWRATEFVQTRPAVPYPNRRALAAYLADADETGRIAPEAVADFSLLQEVAAGTRDEAKGQVRP